MANHIQQVMYEGFLGSDPEMRYTPSGKVVTNFSIGSSSSYTNANGDKVTNTTWLRVSAWGKLAEIVNQYCKKGSHVVIVGRLKGDEKGRPSVFTNSNGDSSASFDVVASEVHFMGGTSDKGESHSEDTDESEFPF